MEALPQQTLIVAHSQLHVREIGGNNLGPEVQKYQAFCGLHPGDPWCACFVSWCIDQAAQQLGLPSYRFKKSGAALGLLHRNPDLLLTAPEPGCVFVIDHGGGKGHTGFAVAVNIDGTIATLEGNTNVHGTRDSLQGDGVWARIRRVDEISGGWLRIE
jgi:hypothetical protein